MAPEFLALTMSNRVVIFEIETTKALRVKQSLCLNKIIDPGV
jgi:hypothetical protein